MRDVAKRDSRLLFRTHPHVTNYRVTPPAAVVRGVRLVQIPGVHLAVVGHGPGVTLVRKGRRFVAAQNERIDNVAVAVAERLPQSAPFPA